MGYSFGSTISTGPAVGGNSSISGGINVGGNPNVHAAITSAASILQNPLTLGLIAIAVVAGIYFYRK